MKTSKKVYVIGGGPLGLGMAHEFLENNVGVTILEAGPKLLGLAETFERNGLEVEKFYHFFYKNDHFMSVDWLKNYCNSEPKIDWKDIGNHRTYRKSLIYKRCRTSLTKMKISNNDGKYRKPLNISRNNGL